MTLDNDLNLLAFDAAPVGIVLAENRVIKACNHTFCTMSGYKSSELLGQSFRKIYASAQEFEAIGDIGVAALTHRGNYSDQRILQRKDGSSIWCNFRAKTLTPDDPISRVVLSYARLGDLSDRPALTPRERDVVMRLSQGLTSKEIAYDLALSSRTVEDIRARLLKKFKAKNAAEMLSHFTNVEG
jgi:PAS domain S-box-containing protein